MKFVHIADIHFETPFTGLKTIENLSDIRRLEQRKAIKKVIDYIKENEMDYLFIAGDLYEHEYVKKSSIDYMNQMFSEIRNTKVFIAPGNHDPYVKGSYYESFDWSENVHICKNEIEMWEGLDVDIYMTAFTDFYMETSLIEKIKIQNPYKTNILVTHCDLNGVRDDNGFSYNPIAESKINGLQFDYVAMGHIHKSNFMKNSRVVYPGSIISFGFDELGEHGMVVGEIEKNELKTEFVRLDDRIFTKQTLNVDNFSNQEELVETIDSLSLDKRNLYEIVLVGNRQFLIDVKVILKLIDVECILKIKDETQIGYDIEMIAKEKNLRGMFVQEVIRKYQDGKYTEEQIKRALELGLEVL